MSNEQTDIGLTVVILTLNEEKNILPCIESLRPLTQEIVVIDSFSTDSTLDILKQQKVKFIQNRFINYSEQRNFALRGAGIKSEWIFMLDADERLSPNLALEIKTLLASNPKENGFQVRRRLYWYGRWIKRGYYPVWLTRLVRREKAYCESRIVNEHLQVEGDVRALRGDIIHEDQNGIERWHMKHLRYAELEAIIFFNEKKEIKTFKRWLQHRIWDKLPLFFRPWVYFVYRYLLRGGFLDGWQGLSFHFFQSLWLQFLISFKIKEFKKSGVYGTNSDSLLKN